LFRHLARQAQQLEAKLLERRRRQAVRQLQLALQRPSSDTSIRERLLEGEEPLPGGPVGEQRTQPDLADRAAAQGGIGEGPAQESVQVGHDRVDAGERVFEAQ
jgi:hypothetical protein